MERTTDDDARGAPRAVLGADDRDGLGISEIEDRAALAATFPPAMFPAHRDEVVEAARNAFAERWLIREFERLPDGPYNHVSDVWVHVHPDRARSSDA